jgi:hypothetical protein
MKATAAAATRLAFAALASAAAATRRVRRQAPSGLDVINTVNSWTNDVIQVNSFLNSAASLSGDALATAAQTAFGFASDEPNQLMLEADLMQVFQAGVLDQLQNIINDPLTPTSSPPASRPSTILAVCASCPTWTPCGPPPSRLSTSALLRHRLSVKLHVPPSRALKRRRRWSSAIASAPRCQSLSPRFPINGVQHPALIYTPLNRSEIWLERVVGAAGG